LCPITVTGLNQFHCVLWPLLYFWREEGKEEEGGEGGERR